MESKTWEYDDIQEKIKSEEKEINDKNILKYEDNYLQQVNSKGANPFCAFNIVTNLLSCSLDYSDKSMTKIESVEGLKDKLKNDLDVSFISNLDQRLNHLTLQHPNTSILFPKFVELVPKKSKRCKFCKKFIVQAEDTSKRPGQKLELCHLFLYGNFI
jgi:hypothetical protein